jgi:tetratricopeptide (TPR) repeat protein
MLREMQLRDEIFRWRDELRRSATGDDVIRAIEGRLRAERDPIKLRLLRFALAQEHDAQGDKAAADAIYGEDPQDAAHRWYENLRRTHTSTQIIEALQDRIRNNVDGAAARWELNWTLASEYCDRGDHAAAEAIYRRIFDDDPDDPLPLIRLSEQKLYYEAAPEEAMGLIDIALSSAYRSGDFRRHALAVKARIALQLKQYKAVEDVLKAIMQLEFNPESVDIGRERDILDRLPPGTIDEEIARRYDQYCTGRPKDRT